MNHKEVAILIRNTVQQSNFLMQNLSQDYSYTAQRLCMPKSCQIPASPSGRNQKKISSIHKKGSHGKNIQAFFWNPGYTFSLIPGNIRRWTLKKYSTIVETINKPVCQQSHTKQIDAIILFKTKEQTSAEESVKEGELWQEVIQSQSDRQFYLGIPNVIQNLDLG